jgi:hypothetical protein
MTTRKTFFQEPLNQNLILSRPVSLKITVRKPLNTRVGVRVEPSLARQVEGQLPMFDRSVGQFANIPNRDLIPARAGHRKAN